MTNYIEYVLLKHIEETEKQGTPEDVTETKPE